MQPQEITYRYFTELFGDFQDKFVEIRVLKSDARKSGKKIKESISEPPVECIKVKEVRYLFPVRDFLKKDYFLRVFEWIQENNSKGYGIFYGVLPREKDGSVYTEKIKVLFQDIDFRDDRDRKKLLRLKEIEEKYGIRIGGENSHFWVISTGRGIHLVSVLDKPKHAEEWLKLQEFIYGVLREFGFEADRIYRDRARVLRFPQTVNWKYEEEPEAYIITEQRSFLSIPVYFQEEKVEGNAINGRKIHDGKIERIANLISPYWKEGFRNQLEQGLLGFLVKSGVDRETARKIVERICEITHDEEKDHRLYLVDYHYNGRKEILESQGRGLSGLSKIRETLESMEIPDEEINRVIYKLQELIREELPNIFVKTKFSRGKAKGFCNVPTLKGMLEWRQTENGIDFGYLIIGACIDEIKVLRNPYTQTAVYEILFTTMSGRKLRVKGNIHEILSRLRTEALVFNLARAEECLSAIITKAEAKGMAQVKEDIEVEGFYLSEGELCFKKDFTETDEEKIREALTVLDELVSKFFAKGKDKAAEVIKWIITAPFNFARKQLGHESWPWLMLVGYPGTGKSTLASLAGYIWDLPSTFEISSSSISTQARLGKILSRWTFPHVVNEIKDIFSGNAREEIRELLKNAWDRLTVRGKYSRGEWIEELSLSPLLMTANVEPELTEAEKRRFKVVRFFMDEKPSKDNVAEFNRWKKNLEKLKVLGREIFEIVRKDTSLLEKDFEETGKEILKRLYEKFSGYIPEWVELTYEEWDDEEREEEIREIIIEEIRKYVNEQAVKYLRNLSVPENENPFVHRLKELQRKGILTDILYDEENSCVIIRQGFLKYLKNEGMEIATLRDLARILGGEVKKVCRRKLQLIGVKVALIPVREITGITVELEIAMKVLEHEGQIEIDGELLSPDEVLLKLKDGEFRIKFLKAFSEKLRQLYNVHDEYLEEFFKALKEHRKSFDEVLKELVLVQHTLQESEEEINF